jgi:hypothetical protein
MFCSLICALALVLPNAVPAYEGGPALVEVLGWEPKENRVYVYELPIGESGAFGVISYMQIDSTSVSKTRVAWSYVDALENNPEQIRRLKNLRQRLEPLDLVPASSLPNEKPVITQLDSVDTPYGKVAALGMHASYWTLGVTFECISYGRDFTVKDVYRIPKSKARVFIVAFKGNPNDGMLPETQVPVVVVPKGATTQTVRVSWEYPKN